MVGYSFMFGVGVGSFLLNGCMACRVSSCCTFMAQMIRYPFGKYKALKSA
ncbi:MAG: hypothetical protein IKW83_08260 [Muribaculaceae bacterium]|nr:hypothetical protein [Muribaculaceae bacterium]